MPVNTRTRIPAAVLTFISHFNRYYVFFTEFHQPGDIIIKTSITIRVGAQAPAIDIDVSIHVNAVELNDEFFSPIGCKRGKCLAVPAGALPCKSSVDLADSGRVAGRLGAGKVFYAPVMGKIQLAPSAIFQIHLLGSQESTQVEAPVVVEIQGVRGFVLRHGFAE